MKRKTVERVFIEDNRVGNSEDLISMSNKLDWEMIAGVQ